ncbi:MAG TPA: hypothetical protein VNM39_05635 [Verrucomicrobiae bacterium]|nr:hypothetical protein [Verrucomicrobiae bacterium]
MNTGRAAFFRVATEDGTEDGSVRVALGETECFMTPEEWARAVAHVAARAVEQDPAVVKQAALDLHAGVPMGSELALAFRDDEGNQGVQRIETPGDGETLAVILRKQNPTITETTIVRRNVTAWVKA